MEQKVTYQPKPGKESLVWKACDALTKNNIKITYKAIGDWLERNGLPRGSYSDIGRFLTTWKYKGNPTPQHASAQSNYSKETYNPNNEPTNVQNKILEEINSSIEAIQKESDKRLAHAMDTINQSNNQINKLKQELESRNTKVKILSEEIETLKNVKSEPNVSEDFIEIMANKFNKQIEAHLLDYEKTLIELYDHHQEQFDKYLNSLQCAKEVNIRLEEQLKSQSNLHKHEITSLEQKNSVLKKIIKKLKFNEENTSYE